MAILQFFVLCSCLGLSTSVPYGFVDRDEQQLIDHLLLDPHIPENQKPQLHHIDEIEEEESEKLSLVNQDNLHKAKSSQNSEQFQLIKKAAAAVVKRLSMPSPPKTDSLVEKAVHFVFKKSFPIEYAKIRSAIKEQVEEMILSNGNHRDLVSKSKISGPRVEKILLALEDILSELAVQLNLTTPQVKFLVNSTVNELSKHFGLKPWQTHELHERVTSHVRAKLKYEDWDNKDARLRRLEENIEKKINYLKLTDKQAKRLEVLMVQEEAAQEGLSKEERLRMLKRVIADIKDDFKTEKLEQESGPPKLSSVNIITINNLIRQKALEMQLTKKELKLLGIAILTAIEKLSLHTNPTPTPTTQETHPAKADKDDLEEELEGTKPPEHATSKELRTTLAAQKHTDHVETHSATKTVTVNSPTAQPNEENISEKKRETEDDLVSMLAQDEADLEEEEFRPKLKKQPKENSKLKHEETQSEQKDELQLELTEKQHHEKRSTVQIPHVTEPVTRKKTEKIALEHKPTKPFKKTEENAPTKPTNKVTHSRHATEDVRKKMEEILEGSVIKPTEYHTAKGLSKTTPASVKTETQKKTEAVTHFVPQTEDKKLEEDRLEDRVTKPTKSHAIQVTQRKTERLIKTMQKTIKTEEEKTTKKVAHQKAKDVDKKLEEDLLEDRMIHPIPTTHSRKANVEKSDKDTDLGEELKEVTKKKVHSRRHRVKVMNNEAEDEDLGFKKIKYTKDSSLEEDLGLLESPLKKSLEDQLAEILSKSEVEQDEDYYLPEDELKDLNDG